MKAPRLLVNTLIEEANHAAQEYGCLPVTVRLTKLDGTIQDIDATGIEFRGNSGLLYIKAQEK